MKTLAFLKKTKISKKQKLKESRRRHHPESIFDSKALRKEPEVTALTSETPFGSHPQIKMPCWVLLKERRRRSQKHPEVFMAWKHVTTTC